MTVAIVANIARPISSALSFAFSMDAMGKLDNYGKLGSWSPSALFAAGEQGAWYDPSDFSTMFQDAAGTSPVTAVEQPVGLILDKSGRGNHASQSTTTKRAILRQDANGKYYLDFDGTDDRLATAIIDFTATDKMSVFAGVRKSNDTVSIVAELSAAVANNAGSFYLVTGNDSGFLAYSSLGRGSGAASPALTTGLTSPGGVDTAVLTVTHDIAGDLSAIRRNGTAGTNATGDKGAGNFGNYPLYIGQRAGSFLPFNGRIYSLIVLGRAATADEITATEAWVANKTGVQL